MLRPERNSSVAGRARAPPAEKRKVTLSCEQCRQRKTRCDKQYPCAACQRSHLECHVVRRCRLPSKAFSMSHILFETPFSEGKTFRKGITRVPAILSKPVVKL